MHQVWQEERCLMGILILRVAPNCPNDNSPVIFSAPFPLSVLLQSIHLQDEKETGRDLKKTSSTLIKKKKKVVSQQMSQEHCTVLVPHQSDSRENRKSITGSSEHR